MENNPFNFEVWQGSAEPILMTFTEDGTAIDFSKDQSVKILVTRKDAETLLFTNTGLADSIGNVTFSLTATELAKVGVFDYQVQRLTQGGDLRVIREAEVRIKRLIS